MSKDKTYDAALLRAAGNILAAQVGRLGINYVGGPEAELAMKLALKLRSLANQAGE